MEHKTPQGSVWLQSCGLLWVIEVLTCEGWEINLTSLVNEEGQLFQACDPAIYNTMAKESTRDSWSDI